MSQDKLTDKQEALIVEAWEILADLVKNGSAKLGGGKMLMPRDSDLIHTFQWLAGLKRPKKRISSGVSDFKPSITARRAPRDEEEKGA